MYQSKEGVFATVDDSTARHLPLLPLGFSCSVTYQLKSPTEFPPLQGFQQSLAMVSPLCFTLHFVPLSKYCVGEIRHTDLIPCREEQRCFPLQFPCCYSCVYNFPLCFNVIPSLFPTFTPPCSPKQNNQPINPTLKCLLKPTGK